jgi:SPP1 family predicted phage head-tail adaptor
MPCRCDLRHKIELQRSVNVVTPEGYTTDWDTYATMRAAVEPATPKDVENFVGATITTPISHLVTMRYRAGVKAEDRVLFRARALYIAGMQNPKEANRELVLACQERAA